MERRVSGLREGLERVNYAWTQRSLQNSSWDRKWWNLLSDELRVSCASTPPPASAGVRGNWWWDSRAWGSRSWGVGSRGWREMGEKPHCCPSPCSHIPLGLGWNTLATSTLHLPLWKTAEVNYILCEHSTSQINSTHSANGRRKVWNILSPGVQLPDGRI